MSNKVGKRLKMLRNVVRLSQKDFAEYLGVNLRSYEKWERGTRLPALGYIMKIADRLQVSIDWLLGRENLSIVYYPEKTSLEAHLNLIMKEGRKNMLVDKTIYIKKIREIIGNKDLGKIKVPEIGKIADLLEISAVDCFSIIMEMREDEKIEKEI